MTAWRELSEAEQEAVQPFLLDCAGLSERDCAQVRADFILAALTAIRAVANELERPPTEREVELLRAALAKHFNLVRIPQLRERGMVH